MILRKAFSVASAQPCRNCLGHLFNRVLTCIASDPGGVGNAYNLIGLGQVRRLTAFPSGIVDSYSLPISYDSVRRALREVPRRWLITGGAGFIGSHLLRELLTLGQRVLVLDNLSTGSWRNLEEVQESVGPEAWAGLEVREGDLRDAEACSAACEGVELVLHQAAIASVPASLEDPLTTHEVNVTGTLHLFHAARRASVQRVVYASSSAVYGTDEAPVKQETATGRLLSPYAASKAIGEVYGQTFTQCYGLETVGLRYFNVFGPRQDPAGPYAAVIPLWIQAALRETPLFVNGDGSTTRDFISVRNVVQANIQAALAPASLVAGAAFNIGSGLQIDLNTLIQEISQVIAREFPELRPPEAVRREFRAGDIQHSLADISKARRCLGFEPQVRFTDALAETVAWFAGEQTTLER